MSELLPGFKGYSVDDKMRMHLVGIAVGTHLHLVTGPSLRRKLQSDFMCLGVGQLFLRMEGLVIMKEFEALGLTVGVLGRHEFCEGILAVTVDAADQPAVRGWVTDFFILGAIFYYALHGTDRLLLLFDIVDGCHI